LSSRGIALAVTIAIVACGGPPPPPPPTPAPGSVAPPPSGGAAADPGKLVGRWMRTDANYLIWIEEVAPDGTLRARYLNPNPIRVSRAEVKRDDGRLRLLVEMQDKGYPGSYYTLTYDAGSDALYGVYHHLGLNQNFDVSFYRAAATASPQSP
jgi:hypothetical protein